MLWHKTERVSGCLSSRQWPAGVNSFWSWFSFVKASVHPRKCLQLLGWLDLFFGLCGCPQIIFDGHFLDCLELFVSHLLGWDSFALFSGFHQPPFTSVFVSILFCLTSALLVFWVILSYWLTRSLSSVIKEMHLDESTDRIFTIKTTACTVKSFYLEKQYCQCIGTTLVNV